MPNLETKIIKTNVFNDVSKSPLFTLIDVFKSDEEAIARFKNFREAQEFYLNRKENKVPEVLDRNLEDNVKNVFVDLHKMIAPKSYSSERFGLRVREGSVSGKPWVYLRDNRTVDVSYEFIPMLNDAESLFKGTGYEPSSTFRFATSPDSSSFIYVEFKLGRNGVKNKLNVLEDIFLISQVGSKKGEIEFYDTGDYLYFAKIGNADYFFRCLRDIYENLGNRLEDLSGLRPGWFDLNGSMNNRDLADKVSVGQYSTKLLQVSREIMEAN